MDFVETSKAPAAIGPYSQGTASGTLVFSSGQIALDPDTGEMVGDNVAAQTRQALENLRHVLAAAGTSPQHVLKATVFLTDMGTFAEMNEVYAAFFGNHRPARSAIEVAALPKGALVEIEAIAER